MSNSQISASGGSCKRNRASGPWSRWRSSVFISLNRQLSLSISSLLITAFFSGAAPPLLAQSDKTPPKPRPLPITKVADGVYAHLGRPEVWSAINRGDIANLSFVIGSKCIAVIDTGSTLRAGLALKAAVRIISQLPICYVINTHGHPDHILGNAAFLDSSAQFVAHHRMGQAQADQGEDYLRAAHRELGEYALGTSLVAPTISIAEEQVLDLGDRQLIVTAHEKAHSNADLTVYEPQARIFWLGDLVFVKQLPVVSGNLNGWISLLDRMAEKSAAVAIPGHGSWTRPGWPEMLVQQRRYLGELRRTVRQAIQDGKSLRETVTENRVGRDQNWALYDEFHPRNVSAAFAELQRQP